MNVLHRSICGLILVAIWPMLPSSVGARDAGRVPPETGIEMGNRAYLNALKRGDAHGFAQLFVDDAVSLPPNGLPVRGRPAIEASMAAAFTRVVFIDGSMHTIEMHISGDTAVEVGAYSLSIRTDGIPTILRGRYVTVWRQIGDVWKISLDSSQADAPTAKSTPIPP